MIERRLAAAVRAGDEGPVLGRAKISYEMAERVSGVSHGGMGLIAQVVDHLGLAAAIDSGLDLLQAHRPYHESDHVLNIAYNTCCGGRHLDDIEARRNDRVFSDALGVASLPDPTTAGDFCRRFEPKDIWILQEAINTARLRAWAAQGPDFVAGTARIDVDATIVSTTGECKEGMDISYKGDWGYSALVVSLANTSEPLYLDLHGANRPSHEGAPEALDKAIALCRKAGFEDILLRGDTDYSMTTRLDRWNADGIRFVFGYDAMTPLVFRAGAIEETEYHALVAKADAARAKLLSETVGTAAVKKSRAKQPRVKDGIVASRGYKKITTTAEDVVELTYRPRAAKTDYRMIALRKNLTIEVGGQETLFDQYRYFFYITNDWNMTPDQVVGEARQRCNQENLHAQLKDMGALSAPVGTLVANHAYMIMASLAWSMKAWCALLLPVHPRWSAKHRAEADKLLRMEFHTFRAAFIDIACQIVRGARKIRWRIIAWNPWLRPFFRLADIL
jgi:hypothetical protein